MYQNKTKICFSECANQSLNNRIYRIKILVHMFQFMSILKETMRLELESWLLFFFIATKMFSFSVVILTAEGSVVLFSVWMPQCEQFELVQWKLKFCSMQILYSNKWNWNLWMLFTNWKYGELELGTVPCSSAICVSFQII